MSTSILKETIIRQQTSLGSFQRGVDYYEQGAVTSLIQRGNVLQASVKGSQEIPYQIYVILNPGDPPRATCTCPYDRNSWCKHIVAALLSYIYKPETVQLRSTLEEQLANLSRDQLQVLILNLVARTPGLIEEVEEQLTLLHSLE